MGVLRGPLCDVKWLVSNQTVFNGWVLVCMCVQSCMLYFLYLYKKVFIKLPKLGLKQRTLIHALATTFTGLNLQLPDTLLGTTSWYQDSAPFAFRAVFSLC